MKAALKNCPKVSRDNLCIFKSFTTFPSTHLTLYGVFVVKSGDDWICIFVSETELQFQVSLPEIQRTALAAYYDQHTKILECAREGARFSSCMQRLEGSLKCLVHKEFESCHRVHGPIKILESQYTYLATLARLRAVRDGVVRFEQGRLANHYSPSPPGSRTRQHSAQLPFQYEEQPQNLPASIQALRIVEF